MRRVEHYAESVRIPGPGMVVTVEADTPDTLRNLLYDMRREVDDAIKRVERSGLCKAPRSE